MSLNKTSYILSGVEGPCATLNTARSRKLIRKKYLIWDNFGLKLNELLESTPTFGNLQGFWKLREDLETQGGFGNPWGFWKLTLLPLEGGGTLGGL
jgi:hypothetical protein